jgi:hypothetical protein
MSVESNASIVGRASNGFVAGGVRDEELAVEFLAKPGHVDHGCEGREVEASQA